MKLPRLTSSTRIVLIMLCAVLCFLAVYALVSGSEYFEIILALFGSALSGVIGFFFGQRSSEHETFSNNSVEKIHDTNSLSDPA